MHGLVPPIDSRLCMMGSSDNEKEDSMHGLENSMHGLEDSMHGLVPAIDTRRNLTGSSTESVQLLSMHGLVKIKEGVPVDALRWNFRWIP